MQANSSPGWEPMLLAKLLVEFLKRPDTSVVHIAQPLANRSQSFLPFVVGGVLNLPKVERVGGCERTAAVYKLLADEGPEGVYVISAFARHLQTTLRVFLVRIPTPPWR
jgi:hypothetical protein